MVSSTKVHGTGDVTSWKLKWNSFETSGKYFAYKCVFTYETVFSIKNSANEDFGAFSVIYYTHAHINTIACKYVIDDAN